MKSSVVKVAVAMAGLCCGTVWAQLQPTNSVLPDYSSGAKIFPHIYEPYRPLSWFLEPNLRNETSVRLEVQNGKLQHIDCAGCGRGDCEHLGDRRGAILPFHGADGSVTSQVGAIAARSGCQRDSERRLRGRRGWQHPGGCGRQRRRRSFQRRRYYRVCHFREYPARRRFRPDAQCQLQRRSHRKPSELRSGLRNTLGYYRYRSSLHRLYAGLSDRNQL